MTVEQQVRARAVETPDGPMVRLQDVETALVLARRQAYAAGRCLDYTGSPESLYPLAVRTRKVLREEPVPGTESVRFRWKDGMLEREMPTGGWEPYSISPGNFRLMRHALDLHDNPYREVLEPADEANPWGDPEPVAGK